VGRLEIAIAAGERGPVIVLSGETDLTTVPDLSAALTAQLANGARHLTVDAAALMFADSASIRALVLAARALKQRGGGLVLVWPQPAVARVLSLLGVDQMITVSLGAGTETEPGAPC
jgi:stage II sporulation protein AA (anti-sigma F factor antagonist)